MGTPMSVPMSARTALKSALEGLLGAGPVVRAALLRLRGARLILAYHNVITSAAPLTQGDSSLHLPLPRFRAQLDAIAAAGLPVVPLDAPADPQGAPAVVVTFDDAYAGTLDVALPELAARGLPSTVFVAPGLLGSSGPWWDQLSAPGTGAIPMHVRDAALVELAGEEARILEAAAARGWPRTPLLPEHRIASADELTRAVQEHPRLSLGSHTWSHPNVARLRGEALERELAAPRDWLRSRFGPRFLDWLAYPYGLATSESVIAAEATGYRGALLVSGGWDRRSAGPHALPRLNVTARLTDAGFRARLAALR